MNTIYKFPFEVKYEFTLNMLRGASVIHVEAQNGVPCMWAEMETDQPLEDRKFRVFGTGHPITDVEDMSYLGMFQQGPFEWHLYGETQ